MKRFFLLFAFARLFTTITQAAEKTPSVMAIGNSSGKATLGSFSICRQTSARRTDLAAQEPARVLELSNLWDEWNAQQIEPLWTER